MPGNRTRRTSKASLLAHLGRVQEALGGTVLCHIACSSKPSGHHNLGLCNVGTYTKQRASIRVYCDDIPKGTVETHSPYCRLSDSNFLDGCQAHVSRLRKSVRHTRIAAVLHHCDKRKNRYGVAASMCLIILYNFMRSMRAVNSLYLSCRGVPNRAHRVSNKSLDSVQMARLKAMICCSQKAAA
jgi:hypothetical protein